VTQPQPGGAGETDSADEAADKPDEAAKSEDAKSEDAKSEDAKSEDAESAADESPDESPDETSAETRTAKRGFAWSRVLAFAVLPALALLLAMAAGFGKWQNSSVRDADIARSESVHAARDSTAAMLSYRSDTVEQQLSGARDLLTGAFRDSYTSLVHDVVIPGAKQKRVSAQANVPAAAAVSANPNHAVVLVFVDQTVTIGNDAPTNSTSSVRVTLDKVGRRWLISQFDPV
jgi:Mce-associated membrane protein